MKQKKANELGLYDMSGNIFEWCWDWYSSYQKEAQVDPVGPDSGVNRVLRGGSSLHQILARSAYRSNRNPLDRNAFYCFRLTQTGGQ